MADLPADIVSGIATGGAIVGGLAVKIFDRFATQKSGKPASSSRGESIEPLLREVVSVSREQTHLLRESRDILLEMKGDHRLMELRLDQIRGDK